MHDSCVVVSLLKAIPIVLTVKILVIFKLAKGLAPWASVWCGGEWANAYPLKSLGGVSTMMAKPIEKSPGCEPRPGTAWSTFPCA